MRIKMLVTTAGTANKSGTATMGYKANETYAMTEPWQKDLAQVFLDNEWAIEVKAATRKPKRRRSTRKRTTRKTTAKKTETKTASVSSKTADALKA
jgi:hypothetical protein